MFQSRSQPTPHTPSAVPAGIAALGLMAALAALVASVFGDSFSVGFGDEPSIGLVLSPFSAGLLVLIGGLGLVVQSFTRRYCIDDPRLARLQWLLLAATLGSAVFVAAATLLMLAAGWLVTSAALAGLLLHRPDVREEWRSLRSALFGLAAIDLSLLTAVCIVTASVGNVPLDGLTAATSSLTNSRVAGIDARDLVAVLIVIAALGRCAQIPFRAWLTETIAVPTPVSALLHAGIVNAGGVLIILTAPLVTGSAAAMFLLYGAAGTTMLYGTSLMIARPDVKGALVLSTRGQMAFMLLQCAIGAFAAAIFHLVAHGMYKASLFLGAGGVIDESRTLARAPQGAVPPARGARALRQALPALLAPALLIALAVAVISPGLVGDSGGLVLIGFAWASAAQASLWWLRLREPSGASRAIALVTLAATVFTYVALLSGAKEFLAPDLPNPGGATVPAALLAPVLALALAATGIRWLAAAAPMRAQLGRLAPLQRRLYARALSAGAWPPRRRGSLLARLQVTRISGGIPEPQPSLGDCK